MYFFHYYVTGKTGEQMERLDRFQWTYGIFSVLRGGKIYSNREISFKNTRQVCVAVKKKRKKNKNPEAGIGDKRMLTMT